MMNEFIEEIQDSFEEQAKQFRETLDETLDKEVFELIKKSNNPDKFLTSEEVIKCMMLYKGLPNHVTPMLFRIERSKL